MLGDLPSDFLTVALTAEQEQVNSDHIHAMTLQHRRRNPLPKLTIFVNAVSDRCSGFYVVFVGSRRFLRGFYE